jgi:hypothetical protein
MKEYRRWLKRMVQRFGKPNGMVPGALLDAPEMERKVANDKRRKKHRLTGPIDMC